MIKTVLGTCALAMGLFACGSNQALLLAQRSRGEAEHLQEYCRRAGIDNAETKAADAALASAGKHLKDGEEEEASAAADLAGTWYRLALARKDLADTQGQVDQLNQGLAKDKDQLQTFQEILSEMKTVRKP